MVLLFYGPSGTGKTMMANALANHLGKRLLLVNFPSLGHNSSDALQFLFREARIQDAVLFFDECEGIFRERDTMLLTEIERHDGLIILATNRPQQLDDAMHRRITMAELFRKPDQLLRRKIWRMHVPERADLSEDVDLRSLAQRYELTGGLIKNAVLAGISEAVARNDTELTLKHADLESGAKRQLKGHLRMSEFDRKIVPKEGFDAMVLSTDLRRRLEEIVSIERASRVLFSQWGFDRSTAQDVRGTSVLLYGPPGTGKTMAAKAIGYELGRPIRLVQPAEVFSCWVGETPKRLEAIFDEASQNNAVLFFDEADALFAGRTAVGSSTDRYANADVNVLLRLIESFSGVAVLTSNLEGNLDDALQRRLQYVLRFPAPDADLRAELWRMMVPDEMPLNPDVDLGQLATDFALTGAGIQNALFRAAARAAGRENGESMVRLGDLRQAAASEETKGGDTSGPIGFDPDKK
jgi:SpoVK/Ycf46/Vps4 family AAA+-type ATPase